MKNKNLDCITDMQWSCKTWRRNGLKVIHAKLSELKRRREVSTNLYVQKNTQDTSTLTFIWKLSKLATRWIGITRDQRLDDPKLDGIAERAVRRVKEGTASVFAQSGQQEKVGVLLPSPKSARRTGRQPRHLMNVGSIHHFVSSEYSWKNFHAELMHSTLFFWWYWIEISSAPNAVNAAGSWTGDLVIVNMHGGLENNSFIWNSFLKDAHQKKWTFSIEPAILYSHTRRAKSSKKESRYLPLCTKRDSDFMRESQPNSSDEIEECPRSRSRCRSSTRFFWSVVGDYIFLNHVAPRTKLYVPTNDFPTLLNYVDVQRQTKTRIEVPHEANHRWLLEHGWREVTVWALDRCDKIRTSLQKSTIKTPVGQRQTDEETSDYKTWKYLAGRNGQESRKNCQRKAIDRWAEEEPK